VRYTRHELKQDKFAESAAEAVHEVVQHRSEIIRIVVAVAVVALLASGLVLYLQSREDSARDALGKAMATYDAPVISANAPPQAGLSFHSDQERLIEAKKQFYAASEKYGSSKSGQYAHYLAAVCEQELGNTQIAEQQLQTVSRSHRGDVSGLAKLALASVYHDENRDQDAIHLLQSAIDKPTSSVPKPSAQLALADLYLSTHQQDKAKVILEQIAKENPNSTLAEIAKSRESSLK
jgi:predicted negative regulator of RcsB-dependent stress response